MSGCPHVLDSFLLSCAPARAQRKYNSYEASTLIGVYSMRGALTRVWRLRAALHARGVHSVKPIWQVRSRLVFLRSIKPGEQATIFSSIYVNRSCRYGLIVAL